MLSFDLRSVWNVVGELGASGMGLGWALVSSALTWGLCALLVAVGLLLGAFRLRWLEPGGRRSRGARIGFGLVLFLVVVPAATGVAVVTRVKHELADQIVEQGKKRGITPFAGKLLLIPLVVAHGVSAVQDERVDAEADPSKAAAGAKPGLGALRDSEGRRALLRSLSARVVGETRRRFGEQDQLDVSFLLDGGKKSNAIRGFSKEMVKRALAQAPAARELQSSASGRLMVLLAGGIAAGKIEDRLAIYGEILGELRPGADGKLRWGEASEQVGERLLRKLFAILARPLDALRFKLILLAVIPPLLAIGIAQLWGRRRRAPAAPGSSGTPGAR
jgi:hypothetical protein